MIRLADKTPDEAFRRRILVMIVAVSLAFAALGAKLWYLQVVRGEYYATRATKLRLDFHWLKAPRGMICGPDGTLVIADTKLARDLVIVPALCEDQEQEVASRLEELLGIDAESLVADIRLARKNREPYKGVVIKQNISMAQLTRVEEFSPILPGVSSEERLQRRYLYGKTAGQLLGYIGDISSRPELLSPESDYKLGDLIGLDGLEGQYEDVLRGRDGQLCVSKYAGGERQLRFDDADNKYFVMDVLGRRLREEEQFRVQPVPGQPLCLTLDMALQQKAEALLERQADALLEQGVIQRRDEVGASIVVLDADTGAVRAMASIPRYDPSVFVSGQGADREQSLRGQGNPMLHRAFREQYAPGSVFKVMLAIAALEEGVITEHTTHSCDGKFWLPGVSRPWRCWRLKYGGHGSVSVVDALAFSCDEFFYNVGQDLGIERIKKWSQRLGLGERTGIDLPRETPGLVPDPEWKRAEMQRTDPDHPEDWAWFPGDTINVSIGQGWVATTPLQNAVLMAAVINGGRRVRPHLSQAADPVVTEPFVSPKTIEIVQRGMRKCVDKDTFPRGTGYLAKTPGLAILGKTGTAQMVGRDKYQDMPEEEIPFKIRDHAFFVAGVIDREHRIAVSVAIEHGLHGSDTAAPMAAEMIRTYYRDRKPPVAVAKGETAP